MTVLPVDSNTDDISVSSGYPTVANSSKPSFKSSSIPRRGERNVSLQYILSYKHENIYILSTT